MHQTQNLVHLHGQTAPNTPPERLPTPQWLKCLAAGNPAVWNLHERPENALEAAREYRNAIEPFTRPCEPERLGVALKRLSLHYAIPQMTETERDSFWADYRADIGHIPGDLIEDACEQWRRDPARKFFPRPCELLEMVEATYKRRLDKHANLTEWLEGQ